MARNIASVDLKRKIFGLEPFDCNFSSFRREEIAYYEGSLSVPKHCLGMRASLSLMIYLNQVFSVSHLHRNKKEMCPFLCQRKRMFLKIGEISLLIFSFFSVALFKALVLKRSLKVRGNKIDSEAIHSRMHWRAVCKICMTYPVLPSDTLSDKQVSFSVFPSTTHLFLPFWKFLVARDCSGSFVPWLSRPPRNKEKGQSQERET